PELYPLSLHDALPICRLRRWRRNDNLFFPVNTAAFFAAFFFQNESVLLRNLCRNIGLDRLVGVDENVEIVHQLLDQLEIFYPELDRKSTRLNSSHVKI